MAWHWLHRQPTQLPSSGPDNNPLLNAVTLEALDTVAQVPEPASLGMLAAGLGLIGFLRRKGRAA